MAKKNFCESLKDEMSPELSESASHFEQEYSKLIEKFSEEAYSKLKDFIKNCKPVPNGAASFVVNIQSFMLNRDYDFWVKVTGEYPNTPIVITKSLHFFSISNGALMYKGKNLELHKWHSADEIFDSACILSRIYNKLFRLHEIFGGSYEYEIPIIWNKQ